MSKPRNTERGVFWSVVAAMGAVGVIAGIIGVVTWDDWTTGTISVLAVAVYTTALVLGVAGAWGNFEEAHRQRKRTPRP